MTKRFKSIVGAAALAVALVIGVGACSHAGPSTGDNKESTQQHQDTKNLVTNQPLPIVYYSQERANLLDIEIAEVNDVRTTSFVMQYGNRDPMYSCPSIGFGIPDSASLSNPLQIGWAYNGWGHGQMDSGVIGQMDPNGIYAPTSSEGTFLICLAANGQPYINRIEDKVDTFGGPAKWDYTLHAAVMNGAPTALATTVRNQRGAVDNRTGVNAVPSAQGAPAGR